MRRRYVSSEVRIYLNQLKAVDNGKGEKNIGFSTLAAFCGSERIGGDSFESSRPDHQIDAWACLLAAGSVCAAWASAGSGARALAAPDPGLARPFGLARLANGGSGSRPVSWARRTKNDLNFPAPLRRGFSCARRAEIPAIGSWGPETRRAIGENRRPSHTGRPGIKSVGRVNSSLSQWPVP